MKIVFVFVCKYTAKERRLLRRVPSRNSRRKELLDFFQGTFLRRSRLTTFREKILAAPHLYIAQPTLDLSVSPTLTNFGIAERHIDLRPFVLSSPYRTEIVQGGLTRVAMQPGSLVVNSSQGGGIKDTWVVDNLHS